MLQEKMARIDKKFQNEKEKLKEAQAMIQKLKQIGKEQ